MNITIVYENLHFETSNITQHQVTASQTYSLHSLEVLLQCEWATRAMSFHAIMQTTPLIVEAEESQHRIKFMVQNYSCGESVISCLFCGWSPHFLFKKLFKKKEGSSTSVVRLGAERIILPETLRTKIHDQ